MMKLRLHIPEDFFLEEEKCGYCVSSEMKKVWAVALDLLNEFDKVCRENDLTYFVSYGTLIGAMRHHGFIPWDDDIDLTMPRADYEALCAIADRCFHFPYFFQTEESDPGFSRPFARLRNSETTAIQRIENNGRIPYNQGIFIDIFPLDNFPDTAAEQNSFKKEMLSKKRSMLRFSEWSLRYREYPADTGVKRIKRAFKRSASGILSQYMIRFKKHNPYVSAFIRCAQTYNQSSAAEWCVPYFFSPGRHGAWRKSCFDQTIRVPFEMLTVPAPAGYDEILTASYGNWREFVIGKNTHGEVFYDADHPYLDYQYKKVAL